MMSQKEAQAFADTMLLLCQALTQALAQEDVPAFREHIRSAWQSVSQGLDAMLTIKETIEKGGG